MRLIRDYKPLYRYVQVAAQLLLIGMHYRQFVTGIRCTVKGFIGTTATATMPSGAECHYPFPYSRMQ